MKTLNQLFFILAGMMGVVGCHSQNDNIRQGIFHYTYKFRDSSKLTSLDIAVMGESNFSFKGNDYRLDVTSGKYITNLILWNDEANEKTVVANINGDKTAIIRNNDYDIEGMKKLGEKKIEFSNEEKTICGYKCKKATFSFEHDSTKRYVYYSKEIKAPLARNEKYIFSDLDGYPMEYNQLVNGKEMITTITKVSFEKLDDDVFKLPEGYQIIRLPSSK